MIEKETQSQAMTVLQAVMKELQHLRPRNVAVFTPYREELTRSVAENLAEAGYSVVRSAGMGIEANCEIGQVEPDEIVRFVEFHMDGIDTDCLFLSCTNWRAIEAIGILKEQFGRPVISSNQATISAVRQMISV